jgi:hypothetical protein
MIFPPLESYFSIGVISLWFYVLRGCTVELWVMQTRIKPCIYLCNNQLLEDGLLLLQTAMQSAAIIYKRMFLRL